MPDLSESVRLSAACADVGSHLASVWRAHHLSLCLPLPTLLARGSGSEREVRIERIVNRVVC
jgi:hypothetical protein